MLWRKGEQIPALKDQGARGKGSELSDTLCSRKQRRTTIKEYEMCKLAAVSTRKTFKEAAESLKKEMGAARKLQRLPSLSAYVIADLT